MIKRFIINNKILLRQMILYGIIGGISALTDSVVFYYMHETLGVYTSNFISINVGITLSFFMNTFLNFKTKDNLLKRAASFFAVGYTGLLISMLIMFVGVELLQCDEMPVKLFSVIVVAALQFLLNKLITFRRSIVHG
ncbi:GtrA family protein [Neobacillus mesonae]|uniref:GtrA/DPMS transmembrane domain-containing protein n=1 Tax=Neobacillus mesonae TaxID=1193713 RepID=A0A3Q9R172_9BACI|nr:GtrA family protein [Neobacillus mesonae]AZU63994.1 hypothetical protein CHR53_23575 [Neobacillus mesonae]